MLTLFFSGTGNTKYIAERFSKNLNSECHSIEENIDFTSFMKAHECICVCYPIYASRVPLIFVEFTRKYSESFKNKKVIILVTQFLFSGDGARSFTDLFPKNHFDVIYAEHFLMPNNVCNFALLAVKNGSQNEKTIQRANKKIDETCDNIVNSKSVKRGFNGFSRFIGLSQGLYAYKIIEKGKRSVVIYDDCTACGLCVDNCPTSNLTLVDNKIQHNNNCAVCYRCVNACPEMAITAFLKTKPKRQYKGV
jgi:Formate hydrogenlyase subunit 6/NADH:ubiquinone oxidoreductase 23 kD subunit (chain I)